jgi:hypothetical protein
MTSPDWGSQVNPSATVHLAPPAVKGVQPLTPAQIGAVGEIILDLTLAQVALALGSINILGVKPFASLTDWGYALQDKAKQAYDNAFNAQTSANFANKQLTVLTGSALASDVSGGVSVNDGFSGAAASTLSTSNWTRLTSSTSTDGSGAGTFGPNGSGQAVWTKSGFISRRDIYRFNTALATDYQAVFAVVSTPPESPLGEDAYLYLIGRMNLAGTEFVYARIGNNDLAIGNVTSSTRNTVPWGGTSSPVWASVSITANPGDQFVFYLGSNDGTTDKPLDFVIKQNGIIRLSYSDTITSTGNKYVGVAAFAGNRFLNLTQTSPGAIDLWAAADRKPTTI